MFALLRLYPLYITNFKSDLISFHVTFVPVVNNFKPTITFVS